MFGLIRRTGSPGGSGPGELVGRWKIDRKRRRVPRKSRTIIVSRTTSMTRTETRWTKTWRTSGRRQGTRRRKAKRRRSSSKTKKPA